MIATVNDIDFDVDHRITAEHTVEHGFFDALLTGRDVFLRNRAADDLVLDPMPLPRSCRTTSTIDVAVLTTTAGLLDELAFAMRGRR